MGLSEQDPDCSSSSSSSAFSTLRERRLRNLDTSTELTLHKGTLRDLELEAEEYVLALINESSPLLYLGSLFKSWWKEGTSSIFSHSLSTSKRHTPLKSPCLETSEDTASCQFQMSWTTVCSIFVLKSLLLFAKPLEFFGNAFEYYLNLMYVNHGLKKTLHTCLFNRGTLKRPCIEDEDYYCFMGLLDPRQELHVQEGILSDVSNLESDAGMKSMADVCVMASKIAYENEKVIKKAVEQEWKMNFVQFFDCWNDYLECNSTQGFIFTDQKQDANIVVVAFRGTQPFNMYDWCTDFDFSYYVLPEIGRVHVGFLEALGLGSRLQKETFKQAKVNTINKKTNKQTPLATPTSGLPEKLINDNGKVLAYDAISAKVQNLLIENSRAKLYITGHSLGGALATLFSALLLIEGNETCSRLGGVFTFGQPRVGDAKFVSYMEKELCGSSSRKYFRVVYRTDVVPRVPFDDSVFQFKHISPCHYYTSCFDSKALFEEPYKDLFSLVLLPTPHFSALKEAYESLQSRFRRGEEYVETGLCVVMRFWAMLCPGLCAHFPTCYVDAVRGAPSSFLVQAGSLEKRSWASDLRSSIGLITFTWPKVLRWSRSSSTHDQSH